MTSGFSSYQRLSCVGESLRAIFFSPARRESHASESQLQGGGGGPGGLRPPVIAFSALAALVFIAALVLLCSSAPLLGTEGVMLSALYSCGL